MYINLSAIVFSLYNIYFDYSSKEKLEIEEELKRLGRFYYSKWNKNPQDSLITRFLLAAENNFHLFKESFNKFA